MTITVSRRTFLSGIAAASALAGGACATPQESSGPQQASRVDELISSMTLEQKIAQLIVPAFRTWEGEDNPVTDLSGVPELAEALRRHQYGGVILFGANVVDADQTVRLVSELQANNAKGDDAQATGVIPYLVAADQEGGSVARLSMGTRGTGSMALGATGENAEEYAVDTGTIFGEELSALGINVNLGPCADVIVDPTDPGMSTRVFSDDPNVVATLSGAFARGVEKSGVVTCFKHFPGAGDGSDFPTAIPLTSEDLHSGGLVPFSAVIANGAEMVMTSATTFPAFDDEQVLADGSTKGFYPATMSPKIVGELLRGELGFDGVVIADALEMEQFVEEPQTGARILPGEPHSVESQVNIAQKCIAAGCDLLLIPTDLKGGDRIAWYDDYVTGIAGKVGDGSLREEQIDASVRRVLELKERHGVLDLDTSDGGLDERIVAAQGIVGSDEHHAVERSIAEHAVTLLKDDGVLPVPGTSAGIVLLGRTSADAVPLAYALEELMQAGVVDDKALVDNRVTGETSGPKDAATKVRIDRYYDIETGKLAYSDELSAAIGQADYVVCLSALPAGLDALQESDGRVQGVTRAFGEARNAGAKFVLLSDNLPMDAARYVDVDAIVCAYLSAGFDVDPTTGSGSQNMRAINANVPAALRAIFGAANMPGRLPVNVKAMQQADDGTWGYASSVLYERGAGLG